MWTFKRWIVLLAFIIVFFLKGLLAAEESEQYPDMVYVPAGEFYMGEDKYYDWTFMLAFNIYDGPEHIVYLDGYYIDKYEVTNEQYAKFIEETGHRIPYCWFDERFNTPDKPVVGVRWEDAVAYAEWAGKRLPTEAEWEKAARGTDRRLWPWGNDIFDAERCNIWEIKKLQTSPVGSYEQGKSPYGCYDMAGNAWEWCADWYDPNYYYSFPRENPKGPESGQQKVIRGGSWHYFGHFARCAARYRVPPHAESPQIGFRCAKSAD
ncbi:formylglycine-generating enzyme family protein [Candidatus Kuenenia sp.]|uniref:formylglycine-generating enzyme family protein n=1 Tax=Candidatus Kuenenia sp. TaxID=2499824 RepID=UPI00321F60FC